MFLSWQFSSQPCEKLCRSKISNFSKVFNFKTLEIIKRTNNIEYIHKCITHFSGTFIFPREKKYKYYLYSNLNEFLNETANKNASMML